MQVDQMYQIHQQPGNPNPLPQNGFGMSAGAYGGVVPAQPSGVMPMVPTAVPNTQFPLNPAAGGPVMTPGGGGTGAPLGAGGFVPPTSGPIPGGVPTMPPAGPDARGAIVAAMQNRFGGGAFGPAPPDWRSAFQNYRTAIDAWRGQRPEGDSGDIMAWHAQRPTLRSYFNGGPSA